MKIVHIGHHCCIRLVKECLALIDKGHEVHLIGFKKPSRREVFKTFTLCSTVSQLEEAIKLHKDVDLFHIHNEPNWMVFTVRGVTDKPIILDIHDSMSYRTDDLKYKSAAERSAFELADGLVYVSHECRKISQGEHKLEDKPSCVLPSYVNKEFYKTRDWAWRGGVVYQGLVSTDKSSEYMQYANYKDLMNELAELGIPFHIYTIDRNEYFNEYYDKLINSETYDYGTLLKNLGHHDWGFIGNTKYYKNWQVAMPNKLFEYLAGGLPIIAMNCKLVEEFVERTGVGISVKSTREIKERWDERARCQANVFKKRNLFSMDKKIHVLEDLYKEVLDGKT